MRPVPGTRAPRIGCLLLILATLAPGSTFADQCVLDTTNLTLGQYDPLAGHSIQAVGSLSYRCNTPVANIRIALSAGTPDNAKPRTLDRVTNSTLAYTLTLDPAHTQIWGDGTNGTSVYRAASAPARTTVTVPVYAYIPALQLVPQSTLTDHITATLTWDP